jgi:hypothetical protein
VGNLFGVPVIVALAILAIAAAPEAAAQTYPCPNGPAPGDYQIGTTGGSHGVASIPICAYGDNGYEVEDDGGDYDDAPYDPVGAQLDVAFDIYSLVAANAAEVDKIANDPKFQRYHNGGWDHFQAEGDAKPGEYCAALYWKGDGLVQISGPGGDFRGAMITFWGPDIPKPKDFARVRVTLKQTGDPAQTVEAFNYLVPDHAFGALALAVPSIEAALAGMTDVLDFELLIAGKTVAKVGWTGGLAARDELARCVKG